MGNKGSKRHLKSLNAPQFFRINRKQNKYITKQHPGRHTLMKSIPLLLAVKKAGLASSTSDAKRIILEGNIRVNNNIVTEHKYPIGMSDILEAQLADKAFKIGIGHNGNITMEDIAKTDYDKAAYKIIAKYKAKGGKVMVRLHDGTIAICSEGVKVNDSVLLDNQRKPKTPLPMKIGAKCIIIEGVHVGSSGTIKQIKKGSFSTRPSVVIQNDKVEFETLVKNIMVVS